MTGYCCDNLPRLVAYLYNSDVFRLIITHADHVIVHCNLNKCTIVSRYFGFSFCTACYINKEANVLLKALKFALV